MRAFSSGTNFNYPPFIISYANGLSPFICQEKCRGDPCGRPGTRLAVARLPHLPFHLKLDRAPVISIHPFYRYDLPILPVARTRGL
jgi:hypothetical protein